VPKASRLCKNQYLGFVIPTKVGIQFMLERYGSPLSRGWHLSGLFTQSPSLGEKWTSIVEQKGNIWILAESSLRPAFVEMTN
jgi:hypothetical protein